MDNMYVLLRLEAVLKNTTFFKDYTTVCMSSTNSFIYVVDLFIRYVLYLINNNKQVMKQEEQNLLHILLLFF